MSSWNEFRKKMKGKGYSITQLSEMYKNNKSKTTRSNNPTKVTKNTKINKSLNPKLEFLTHSTDIYAATKILKDGYLRPRGNRTQMYGGSGKYVYTDPYCGGMDKKSMVKRISAVTFYIDAAILADRSDYHLGIGWKYGDRVKHKYYSKEEFGKWFDLILKDDGSCSHNEIIFEKPIPIKYIHRIDLNINYKEPKIVGGKVVFYDVVRREFKMSKDKILETYIPAKYRKLVKFID